MRYPARPGSCAAGLILRPAWSTRIGNEASNTRRRRPHGGGGPGMGPVWLARGVSADRGCPGSAIVGHREECTMLKLRSKILGAVSVVAVAGAVAATGL